MTINGEECELVTDFGQLRAGAIVWELNCDDCGGAHRFFVIGLSFDEFSETGEPDDPTKELAVKWEALAEPHGEGETFIDQESIDSGDFYRVVDPLLNAQTTERKRELARG